MIIDSLISVEKSAQNEQTPSLDKKQKILKCIASGNSKLYLCKNYTEEQIHKAEPKYIDKLFSMYESKLSSQTAKSLGKSTISMYSKVTCYFLKIGNQQELSDHLKAGPFLNSVLQFLLLIFTLDTEHYLLLYLLE